MRKWGTFIHWKTFVLWGPLLVNVQGHRAGMELTVPVPSPAAPGADPQALGSAQHFSIHQLSWAQPQGLLRAGPPPESLAACLTYSPSLRKGTHPGKALGSGLREALILPAHPPDPCSLAGDPRTDQQVCRWHRGGASGGGEEWLFANQYGKIKIFYHLALVNIF